ncbi:LLM class flavin-dependent oxidoreductase [Plantactinospora sp. KLBMP9567]|uniref:LLM class flavin-dependent oxidoreductase n=1 Tax=Plantactinospora sp. KLBMP9567 TaxID=3085900 RepID=UPI002981E304|nr:LLM class flavin-dependent oxidoreductase [Plantactinospora sp. KLBMP9567]MDW5328304.1 LLM class flavin-dependent oxidoreductase [Plantactinospora sp. KLBMP9567]
MVALRVRRRLGVMFDRHRRPEDLVAFARAVEAAGVDDLWLVEDLGSAGSVASTAIALAVTERIRVGIGVAPVPLRNQALLAMELATLAGVYQGRLVAAVGHGKRDWMPKLGAATDPANRIALFTETIRALRSLLRGDTVKLRGRAVHLDGVRLAHPPTVPPPVVSGVPGARSTELTILRNNTMHYLSGQVADGTIISEGHGPAAIASALYYIEAGREAFETTWPHEVIVFALHHVKDDPDQVHAATTEAVEERARNLGVGIEDVFLAAGTATTTAERVHSLWDAGAETVVLRPIGADPLNHLRASLTALQQIGDRPEP